MITVVFRGYLYVRTWTPHSYQHMLGSILTPNDRSPGLKGSSHVNFPPVDDPHRQVATLYYVLCTMYYVSTQYGVGFAKNAYFI